MDLPVRRWWRRRSLRARLTLLATAAVAAGLAAGAILLLVVLERTQIDSLDDGAERTASEVATLVDADRLPDPVPIGSGTSVVQVLDAQDRVIAASASGDHLVPLLTSGELDRVRDGARLSVPGSRAGVDDNLRVVAVIAGPDKDRTVLVAVSLRDVRHGLDTIRSALMITTPILLGLIAALCWQLVGLALRPVDALRSGAEEIRGTGGSRRLPVPVARDEVNRLAVTLNGMLARLEAASARQRGFVSDAAHELRSPLASIRAQLEVGQRVGDVDSVVEGVLEDVERLSLLVDDLLLLARLDESSGRAPHRELVDLDELSRDVTVRYVDSRVPVTVDGIPAILDADPVGLRRVLTNLIDNAVRHARTGVHVHTSGAGPGWVEVTVRDDGPGIPADKREQVFDRFTRLDDARAREEGGTGLGLPIVRELVAAHGGTVTLRDAGPGLVAVVRLPTRPVSRT